MHSGAGREPDEEEPRRGAADAEADADTDAPSEEAAADAEP